VIQQLADRPPETIVFKSLEVLSTITVPVDGENVSRSRLSPWQTTENTELEFPMNDSSLDYATRNIKRKSRDREVFASLIQLHSDNEWLLADLSSIMTYMCKMQPPEFVMISFAVELHCFVERNVKGHNNVGIAVSPRPRDLALVSACVQNMNHVIFNTEEARDLRDRLKDCIACKTDTEECRQKSRLFHILLHSFSHNLATTLSLCLWAGAYRTAYLGLNRIDPLDINLMFLLEIDRLIEMLERPIFR
jgi:Vacuolar protein 14 C-terminal Fig4p binding